MENTISHFQVEGLEIKLTEDKLFINTATSNEAFALRSIDGIGVIDLVEDYNIALSNKSAEKRNSIFKMIIGCVFILSGLGLMPLPFFGIPLLCVGFFVLLIGIVHLNQTFYIPILMSSIKIMLNGGNRDFVFDKANTNSQNIAEFVANVENTLTAFHKNN